MKKTIRFRFLAIAIVCSLFLGVAPIIISVLIDNENNRIQAEIDTKRSEVAILDATHKTLKKIKREQQAAESNRKFWEDLFIEWGYSLTGTPGLYYRFADISEFTCGYWDCALVLLATGPDTSCPRSVYIEANIMRGGAVIGWTNGTLGSLDVNGFGSVFLEDHQDTGGDFQLTQVSCY